MSCLDAGFKIFVDEGVDVAILEVGLGGRLDATNIVPQPVVCGVTSLGFDHMELLGNTLRVALLFKRRLPERSAPSVSDSGSPSLLIRGPESLRPFVCTGNRD